MRSLTQTIRLMGLLFATALLTGCPPREPVKIVNRYPTMPLRKVPAYMHDTIFELTDLSGTEPLPVSGYGLVANLLGTGGSRAPMAVRDYIIKEMGRRGFGNANMNLASPEVVLGNRSFAIVRVDALIPPGARSGLSWADWMDATVSALPESDVTSLAHGDLYLTDLKVNGANSQDPGSGNVLVMAQSKGPIFINPAYALEDTGGSASARSSRRAGSVMDGCRPTQDRPLTLKLRQPERRVSRAMEKRINEQFQDQVDDDLRVKNIAAAQDEGIIQVYVPRIYDGDWEHFAGLLKHTYMHGGTNEFAAVKARELADAAVQPGAPLMDISYAWESLGKSALPFVAPLMTHPSQEIAFAASRAAAFLGDAGAVAALLNIAQTPGNPFRVNAVQVLGAQPSSPLVNSMLRRLLNTDQALVRIEAYKVLAKNQDSAVITHVVKRGEQEKFAVDLVPCDGPPIVYATRRGIPRIAIIGKRVQLESPTTFLTLQNRLTVTSQSNGVVNIFYRGGELARPVNITCGADLADIVCNLAGDGAIGPIGVGLDFGYPDVIAMVQAMADQKKIVALRPPPGQSTTIADATIANWPRLPVNFVLQEGPNLEDALDSAPIISDGSRPQTDAAPEDKKEVVPKS